MISESLSQTSFFIFLVSVLGYMCNVGMNSKERQNGFILTSKRNTGTGFNDFSKGMLCLFILFSLLLLPLLFLLIKPIFLLVLSIISLLFIVYYYRKEKIHPSTIRLLLLLVIWLLFCLFLNICLKEFRILLDFVTYLNEYKFLFFDLIIFSTLVLFAYIIGDVVSYIMEPKDNPQNSLYNVIFQESTGEYQKIKVKKPWSEQDFLRYEDENDREGAIRISSVLSIQPTDE